MYERVGKRWFDVVVALAGLPVVAAVGMVVSVALKIEDGGPTLYCGQRRGRDGVPFTILKFRSMVLDAPDLRNADGSTFSGASDPRVTRVGRFLRRSSLDELPQLMNVLRGDMSLVGPRPTMAGRPWEELDELERKRLRVRPGITGLAQWRFRNSVSSREKFEADCEYVDGVSLLLDMRILVGTLTSVVLARNIHSNELESGETLRDC